MDMKMLYSQLLNLKHQWLFYSKWTSTNWWCWPSQFYTRCSFT